MAKTLIEPIERSTNKIWNEWLEFMEQINAKDLNHHDIAEKVYEELNGKIDKVGWWAQAVTVTYEQYIGRRIPGQMPDGKFQTSASKSTKLEMKELMDKWTEFASIDQEVLDLIENQVKVSGTKNRITWRTKGKDGSSIIITSEPKSNGTASIIATHMGLLTLELSQEAKEKWVGILNRFLQTFTN